jgi:hypothetical protein
MKLGKDPMQVRIGLVVFRDKPPPYSVRLSVRTAGFQSAKRGSIPLQSTTVKHTSGWTLPAA